MICCSVRGARLDACACRRPSLAVVISPRLPQPCRRQHRYRCSPVAGHRLQQQRRRPDAQQAIANSHPRQPFAARRWSAVICHPDVRAIHPTTRRSCPQHRQRAPQIDHRVPHSRFITTPKYGRCSIRKRTIPIATALQAVQSNKVYLPREVSGCSFDLSARQINADR